MIKPLADSFDVVIVGGGMAGATMALALAPLNLSIALIETHPYKKKAQPSFDDRCIALAWSSRQIYQAMGLWEKLRQCEGVTAINRIHISDKGHLGVTRLDQQEEGVPALGYVVESRVLGDVLIQELQQFDNIHLYCPAKISQIETSPHEVKLNVKVHNTGQAKTTKLVASLLIAADGMHSTTREFLGIRNKQHSYSQTAIIANIETEIHHNNVAYERFTDSGPLAILPLTENRCSLVWTAKDEQVEDIMSLDDTDFINALQQRFGYRLGQIIRVGQRSRYPLVLMTIDNTTMKDQHRVALIGNAAHGVHPVAGQGFNLGLRDISALSELLAKEVMQHKNSDPGNQSLLKAYWDWRQADIRQVTTITNNLIKLFSNQSKVLAVLRNSGLLMTDIIRPLKHLIAQEAIGQGVLQGKLSKMAAGQPLIDTDGN